MDGFTVSETLNCAPADVWAYLVEFGRAPEWVAGIADFTQITPSPLEIGAGSASWRGAGCGRRG